MTYIQSGTVLSHNLTILAAVGNLVLSIECVCWFSSCFESALSKPSIDIVRFSDKASLKEQSVELLYCSSALFYNPIETELLSVSPGAATLPASRWFPLFFSLLLLPLPFHLTSTLFPFFHFFLLSPYFSPNPFLSFLSFHLISVISSLSLLLPPPISPPSLKVYVLLFPLCCSRAFISAVGAPLASCQSLLVQKPAHSSNTIHCTCIRTQPIVTARPSDQNHPSSFFQ